jgi:hypothetical protein
MRFFLLSLLALLSHGLHAGVISGTVLDEKSQPLPSVNIFLLSAADSSILKTELSDANGHYAFTLTEDGSFLIKAIGPGFQAAFSAPFRYTATDVSLPELILQRTAKGLNEVTVRSQKPLIEVKADKLVMNVDASIANTGSTAFEVLQRAPGVSIDQNDNISMKGRQGVNIMIDGKLMPLRGEDLVNLLKGMPSGSVDQIELIANPGARYDAAGTAGIINIRTKKDKRLGVNGTLTAGYGQGIHPKTNAGASLNYRAKKLALFANYNAAFRRGINDLDLLRRFYKNGQLSTVFHQHDEMTIDLNSHYATLGGDYSISKTTTVGAMLSGGITGFDLSGYNATQVDANGAPVSSFFTDRANHNSWDNRGVNLNLRQKLDTAGSDLSVDVDYARYSNTSDQTLGTSYFLLSGQKQYPDYLLYGSMSGYTDIRALKADYTKPVNKSLRLEAGIKASMVTADNNPQFYDRSGGGNEYDSTKSNHFIYDEAISAAYVNAVLDGTLWSLQAGLRGEQTVAKGHQLVNDDRFDRRYAQLFPSLALTRHLNPQNDLGITLSRRIERPNYQQLNPFRRYLDVSSVNQGNPYLQPALTWSAELTHTWKGRFITQLSWSRTNDVIVQVIQPESGTLTIVTDKNLATNTICNFSGSYPLQPFKWWHSVNNVNLFYSHYEGDLAQTPLSDGIPTLNIYSQNSFTLPKDWSAELNAMYQSEQLYGYMHIDAQFILSIGAQKNFWQKRGTLKLSISDLFFGQSPHGRSDFSEYHEDFDVKRDTRIATLSFTYRFGQRSVAPARRRQRGAEEELQRAGGGNAG